MVVSAALLLCGCSRREKTEPTLFELVPSKQSGIEFVNNVRDTEQFNIIDYLYFYNGGGVAIGDINNDGLADIYFSSNQQPNKLYLNKGNFTFEDITEKAGVEGAGNWKTGVTMVDINLDGYLDIYLCGVGRYKNFNGFNQLFINNGDLTFTESAKVYGLDFQGLSTHSIFFDYDRDGDLDMYLLNHSVHSTRSYGNVNLRYQTDSLAGDRLYKNTFRETGRVFFEDVSRQAGILSSQIGYGLGVAVSDLNRDGYPDIYVSNDFHENDYLYINQRDGTFREESKVSLAHSSRFSMGNDVADINNDGWPDIISLDMLPREESIIKSSAGEDSYEVYKFKLSYGYGKQVSRNALQINHGPIDSGRVVFSDIAQVAGIEATDWSWTPLAADFDGDGWKDLFVANGILRRPNDLDYINFFSTDSAQSSSLALAGKMPEGRVSNFIFQNRGGVFFEDKTNAWGLYVPSLSNGAAYGDLDNDGDLDLVVNQMNGPALIYRNQATTPFVALRLQADALVGNPRAVGATVEVTTGQTSQVQTLMPSRGFCSSSDYRLSFATLGADTVQVAVRWPDGAVSRHTVGGSQALLQYRAEAEGRDEAMPAPWLQPAAAVPFRHREDDFNAFNREALIPHMLSTLGPALAVADIDGDGDDDVFVGGGKGQPGQIFLQTASRIFRPVAPRVFEADAAAEDVAAVFFDADGDGDPDLVVAAGGQEEMQNVSLLQPRLYLNDGRGKFSKSESAFANVFLHASCVRPCDYDGDGDIDLFIGSPVMPFLYGMSPVSFLLNNNGKGVFSPDAAWLGTSTFNNPTRVRPGMVKDAAWADVNGDQRPDLVLAGEWMPITILIQQADHTFSNQTDSYGLTRSTGWWNAIEVGDFDGDGDPDFVVGNLGLNSRVKATPEKPLVMYLGDFDSNGASDHILVYYNGDKSYPFASRDQLVKQIPSLKKKFLRYSDYRAVNLEDIITPAQKGNSAMMQVECLTSSYFRNEGGRFVRFDLPVEAQFFPVFGIKAGDINHDGHQDILLAGNLDATQPDFGAYDAGVGLVLTGDGRGNFTAVPPRQSGFVVRGEGRKIAIAKDSKSGDVIYLVSRNNNTVLSFQKSKP
jgi:hypothetical protein